VQFAIVQPDAPIAEMIIAIVVANDDHRLARRPQLGKEASIELFASGR